MKENKKLPCVCPSCSSALLVTSLGCPECETIVSGKFHLPNLAQLDITEQQFIVAFVKSSGSLKIMAQQLGLSYPTVRNLLDDIILKLTSNENAAL